MNKITAHQRITAQQRFNESIRVEKRRDASHLSKSDADTAQPKQIPQNLDSWLDDRTIEIDGFIHHKNGDPNDNTLENVEAYWKSKEGKCLACGLDIAVQDSYCPACHSFLLEVHTQSEADRFRIEIESD